MNSIPFNIPYLPSDSSKYINKVFAAKKFCGDGQLTMLCSRQLENLYHAKKVLLTTSCTHSLEMAAILCGIQEGDEVVMSSFTFVSTANAFILRGAKIVFVDIDPATMNIDESLIEAAITQKTKAIVVMHYGGVACNMNAISRLANQFNLFVIEDAAQCIDAYYFDRPLGSIGVFGTLSFHETKNIHCGEGGALIINDDQFIERAEIIREKGTDRSRFLSGMVDKYSWVDIGSSYLPSELNAAILLPQLESFHEVTEKRVLLWNLYFSLLSPLYEEKLIVLPFIPAGCQHNGHLFYIKCKDVTTRTKLMAYLKKNNVHAYFHYVPLHSSLAGKKYTVFHGEDIYTTSESERILRLPLYFGLTVEEVHTVCDLVSKFFNTPLKKL